VPGHFAFELLEPWSTSSRLLGHLVTALRGGHLFERLRPEVAATSAGAHLSAVLVEGADVIPLRHKRSERRNPLALDPGKVRARAKLQHRKVEGVSAMPLDGAGQVDRASVSGSMVAPAFSMLAEDPT
jgi:hypothetical protein